MPWSNRRTRKVVVSSIFSARERSLKPNILRKNQKKRSKNKSKNKNCLTSNLQNKTIKMRRQIWMKDLEKVRTEVKNKKNSYRQSWRKLTLSHKLIKVELRIISRVIPTPMKCSMSKRTTTAILTLSALRIGKTQFGEAMLLLEEVYTLYALTV